MPARALSRINKVDIHMYRMGTGDCFVVKFKKGNTVSFTMLIDCGCWSGDSARLTPYLKELKKDVNDHVDVLVVTHEHKDHAHDRETAEPRRLLQGRPPPQPPWHCASNRPGHDDQPRFGGHGHARLRRHPRRLEVNHAERRDPQGPARKDQRPDSDHEHQGVFCSTEKTILRSSLRSSSTAIV